MGEGDRVGLGEPEVGEGGERSVDGVGRLAGDPRSAMPAYSRSRRRPIRAADRLARHGLAQLVGLGDAEPGDGDRHLHQLLLEQGHPEGPLEDRLEQRVQVGDRLEPAAAADVGVDRLALDGSRADERHLDHQVVEAAGLDPGQRRPSGPGSPPGRPPPCRPGTTGRRPRAPGGAGQVDRPPRGARRPDRPCGAGPRACRGRAGRTSPGRSPRSRPCPTAAPCGPACAPTPPGRPRPPDGHR